jgi:S-adenosyl-L-homocysteine hydrolase-like protein
VTAASPVFAGYVTRVWTELVLRSFARETNLLLPSTHVLLVGGGPVADGLATALTRLGSRVGVASDDPVKLVAIAHRSAVVGRHIVTAQFISADVDVVITTGQSHPPLTPDAVAAADRPLIAVNATPPPDGDAGALHADGTIGTARNLTQFSGSRPIFVVPRVSPAELDHAVADVRSTFADLLATVGPDDVETELAKVLLS